MAFENKQKITEIDLGWQKADHVCPLATFDNDDFDKDPSALNFAWFKVDTNIKPSEKEEQEKIQAMREQFEAKVINKYGLPYGMPLPKEYKKIIKEQENKKGGGKWDRQRKRLIDRQIEKDMKKLRAEEQRGGRMIDSANNTILEDINSVVNTEIISSDAMNRLINKPF